MSGPAAGRRWPTVDWPPARHAASSRPVASLRALLVAARQRVPTPQSVLGGLALAVLVLLAEADGTATEYPPR